MFWRRYEIPATWEQTLQSAVHRWGAVRAVHASRDGLSLLAEPEEETPEIHRLAAIAGEFLEASQSPIWKDENVFSQATFAENTITVVLRMDDAALAMQWEGNIAKRQREIPILLRELSKSPLRKQL
ncbi:MAG: hypothetical protein OEM52_13385 [bacterium]|nr:hypothetical protein [bacterium]